jgi:orotidine-5'-phosphate decarboxylase
MSEDSLLEDIVVAVAFNTRFCETLRRRQSCLCVGLDPELDKLPPGLSHSAEGLARFCCEIISAAAPFAAAFKVNFAFFEALGRAGWEALAQVAAALPEGVIKIADAKRGDIGNTARLYAHAIFRELPFDALTANAYLGEDAALPFLEEESKGAFFLCRTSNPGSASVQLFPHKDQPLYLHVAREVVKWNGRNNAGLVVGATQPVELEHLRRECPDLPFLIPGVGAQGGDLESAVKAAGMHGDLALINASRAILYAAQDSSFAEAAARAAESLLLKMKAAATNM